MRWRVKGGRRGRHRCVNGERGAPWKRKLLNDEKAGRDDQYSAGDPGHNEGNAYKAGATALVDAVPDPGNAHERTLVAAGTTACGASRRRT